MNNNTEGAPWRMSFTERQILCTLESIALRLRTDKVPTELIHACVSFYLNGKPARTMRELLKRGFIKKDANGKTYSRTETCIPNKQLIGDKMEELQAEVLDRLIANWRQGKPITYQAVAQPEDRRRADFAPAPVETKKIVDSALDPFVLETILQDRFELKSRKGAKVSRLVDILRDLLFLEEIAEGPINSKAFTSLLMLHRKETAIANSRGQMVTIGLLQKERRDGTWFWHVCEEYKNEILRLVPEPTICRNTAMKILGKTA